MIYTLTPLLKSHKPDARERTPEDLQKVFVETNSYDTVRANSAGVLLVIGNKGTGKSAILQQAHYGLKPHVLAWEFKRFYSVITGRVKANCPADAQTQNLDLCYEQEWMNELWIALARAVYQRQYRRRPRWFPVDFGAYVPLYDFLCKYGLHPAPTILRSLADWFRSAKPKITVHGVTLEANQPSSLPTPSPAVALDNLKEPLCQLLRAEPFHVLIDELDGVPWEPQARSAVRGLLRAAKSVATEILQAGATVNVCIGLRSDMLEAIKSGFVELDKYSRVDIETVWSAEKLRELLARLISVDWGLPSGGVSPDVLITEVFPCEITPELNGFAFLHGLTTGKPRELPALAQRSIAVARSRQEVEFPGVEARGVTEFDLMNSILEYSRDQLDFFREGFGLTHPQLSEVIDFLRSKPKLFAEGVSAREALLRALRNYLAEARQITLRKSVESWPTRSAAPEEMVVEALYDINFWGTFDGLQAVYKYPGGAARNKSAAQLIVHPVYRAMLFGYAEQPAADVPVRRIKAALERLFSAIQNMNQQLDSVIEARKRIPDAGSLTQNGGTFASQNQRYVIAEFLWALRHAQRHVIAYAGLLPNQQRPTVSRVWEELSATEQYMADVYDMSQDDLHLTAILMSTGDCAQPCLALQEFAELDNPARLDDNVQQALFGQAVRKIRQWQNRFNPRAAEDKKQMIDLDQRLTTLNDAAKALFAAL